MVRALRLFSGFAALLGWLAQASPAEAGFRKIMEVGDPAPGLPAGSTFSMTDPDGAHYIWEFFLPPLNGAGQSAFGATGEPGFVTGVWLGDGTGPPTPVAAGAIAAPGLPGLGLSAFSPGLNDAGEVAFHGFLEGFGVTSANDQVLYGPTGAPGFALLAREGDAAPGAGPGVTFGSIGAWWNILSPRNPVDAAGQVAFTTSLAGAGVSTSNDAALWLTDGAGGLSLVVREGDPAPGTGAGIVFGLSIGSNFALSEAGHVAFEALLAGPGVTASNDRSLWIDDGASGLALVAREGDPVPGMDPGVVFASFPLLYSNGLNQNDLNDVGDLAFVAALAGPGIDPSNDQGIFVREATGALRLAAREGASGVAAGVDLVSIALNDAGEVAFETSTFPSFCDAVWGPDGSGGLRRVVQVGDPLPDVPGATFDGTGCNYLPILTPELSINAHGDVTFEALINDGDVYPLGLVFASTAGELVTVLHDFGDALELAPGDVRSTVYGLKTHPFATLNDARQILLATSFDVSGRALLRAELYTDCVDGIDNDGDGATDFINAVGDPGCQSEADPSEHARRWVCDNGIDDDGDGMADHPADPGCNNLIAPRENPQCQDGLNNDGQPGIDFDGGASVTGVPGPADPQCAGRPWWNQEAKSSTCGLGFESVLLLLPIAWLRARRRRGA